MLRTKIIRTKTFAVIQMGEHTMLSFSSPVALKEWAKDLLRAPRTSVCLMFRTDDVPLIRTCQTHMAMRVLLKKSDKIFPGVRDKSMEVTWSDEEDNFNATVNRLINSATKRSRRKKTKQ